MTTRAGRLVAGITLASLSLWPCGDAPPERYLEEIKYLSSKSLKGRASGSEGLERAAHHIESVFRKAGLRPLEGRSYLQPFAISVKSELGTGNRLSFTLNDKQTELRSADDLLPFGFSAKASVKGEVAFVGYGITAPEYNYDDYAGLDVHGKLVIVLRHEPQEFDGASVFEGRVYSEHAQLFSKALNARAHGAIGVLYVNDTANHSTDKLEKFVSLPGPADAGIPFVQVASTHVEKWLIEAHENFRAIQEEIDRTLKPHSFALPSSFIVELCADVRHEAKNVYNVVGYLPGATDDYVIVGAHYDHLGLGEQYSLAPDKIGTIHPGADDNASGVAAVMELARRFACGPRPIRGIVFIAFAGEELGLLGSSYFVNHPLLPLNHASVMINMDMIGRIHENKVMIGGAPEGSNFRRTLEALGGKYGLDLDLSDTSVYGSSDHTSFKAKRVPTLFFFTGLHGDYHRPTDTWDKIEVAGTSKLLHLIGDLLSTLTTPKRTQLAALRPTP